VQKKRGISSREMIKKLIDDSWYLARITGDHYHYKHPTKKGTVTVQHPVKDLSPKIVHDIIKKSGL
jgi:predicted RNA binding protein YcfA (HicA-like mRNA interferase family)